MIRRSPAENYFRYLVVHPNCFDDLYIQTIATELKLDYLGHWYTQNLRSRLQAPKPFYPEDDTHAASYRFLLREGLLNAFIPDAGYKEALRILAKPRWREVVESMLLAGAPVEDVARAVRVRLHGTVGPKGVQAYRYWFWNIDLLESMEMRALLEMRNSGHLSGAPGEPSPNIQYLAIRSMRHTDPRAVAARLPSTPLAGLLSQLELGAVPQKINISEVIDKTMEAALLRTYGAVMAGGPMGVQMGQGFAVIADIMGRLRETVSDPEESMRDQLKRISMATTAKKVPSIQQLSGGNHTTNVMAEPVEVETTAEAVEDK